METRLSHFTTFRLGGPCRELATVADAAAAADVLRAWNAAGRPWRVMGGGSNLLVADAGIPECVLRYSADKPDCRLAADGTIETSAATPLDALAEFAAETGRGGVGFASGIPGTVGGGLCGNAGAFGRQLGDVLDRVEILTRAGELRQLPRSALEFAYRASSLPQMGAVVVRAWFRTEADDRAELRAEREKILALRREKHPDWRTEPTAGSFFKNLPPAGPGEPRRAAGKYLEQAGAKDLRAGAAYVFPKHANIVVAGPGATARDVATLAGRMAAAVRGKFGFELEPEVRFWGAV
ncbi:MAG TPA: UDP-N-acetylmuramate dehydrogenase [Kiritimatiellia bacterium]|nr:UDP-N-acetylmuramate dehydrogenase [Kiritimatiellia bacterium]